jgi:hypothetical protein
MPRVPEQVLDSVFYLYASEDDARSGKHFGGTGFFVWLPATDGNENDTRGWIYAVTNWHLAVRGGFSVIRVNTENGPPDIFDLGPEEWHFDPKYDVAITPVRLKNGFHKFSVVPTRIFCSELVAANQGIGPGDELFMVGRFVDHDGGETNQPAVRFGHISINPTLMKQGANEFSSACYCVDIHSRTGYSGSPVFVYRTPGSDLSDITRRANQRRSSPARLLAAGVNYFGLLGIHFAQFPELWEVGKHQPQENEALIAGENPTYVKGMSGMTCVLPAWTIGEVLNSKILVDMRGGKKLVFTFGHHQNLLPTSQTS